MKEGYFSGGFSARSKGFNFTTDLKLFGAFQL